MTLPNINLNKLLILTGITALVLFLFFWFWWADKEILINNGGNKENSAQNNNLPESIISGIKCENAQNRPIGVMYSGDQITRPLSGISSADVVFEMPVTPGGVTRMMAIFQCSDPGEIGSVRSAREDFIPLAAGLGTILVHWGGERGALKKLDSHIIDNIDAMVYENTYFYRKSGIKQPHNGFAKMDEIIKASDKLKYEPKIVFEGYPHKIKIRPSNIINIIDTINIDYPSPFNVKWIYDRNKGLYQRHRGGEPEIDRNNNEQVAVSVVALMKTDSSFTSKDYLTVNTTGEGELEVYQNETKIFGRWKKDPARIDSKLFFYDSEGKEIEFAPGKMWVEIVTNN